MSKVEPPNTSKMKVITVQEIRVGNLIDENGKITKVTPALIEIIWAAERDWIKPIPLTEELLVRFGFFSKYKSCNRHWYNGSFALDQKSDEDDDGNKIPTEQVFYYDFRLEINYVHQLQNLYFALTETELTLNPNN